jgi:lipopolysaccharide heptosyltransferase II
VLKVRFLKNVDRFIGTLAVLLTPRPEPVSIPELRRVLFIRPGGIGDAVLLIPVIRAVMERYPGCEVTVLAEKRNAVVFSLCGEIRRTLRYDRLRELKAALRGRYDMVVDTEQWHRLSALIARLSGAPALIGFATNERSRMFTHSVPYTHEAYEVDSFFSLLEPLGFMKEPLPAAPFLQVPERAAAGAHEKLGELLGRPFISVFPGASIPERRWGTEKFHELALRLNRRGYPVVVVGGKGDEQAGQGIVGGGIGLNLAGKTSLAETAAVISRSLLMVSGDSGLLHMAVGLGVRTVSLFGPGIEKKWAPKGGAHLVLNRRLSCSPCTRFGYTPRCRIGARCLADMGVDEVEYAVLQSLERCTKENFREPNKFLDNKDVTC